MPASKEKLTPEQMSQRISDLNKSLGYSEVALSESPTAYTNTENPTRSDLLSEINIRKLQNQKDVLESQVKQAEWYGKGKAPEERGGKRHEGLLEKGLGALSAPLHGIVGGVQALTGTGSVPGWQNVSRNLTVKENFGDVLRKVGAPGYVSAPLGFMLDVTFDPVNWATAGTGALIPRIGAGLIKGGSKGALKGAESGFLGKASTISRILTGSGQKGIDDAVKAIEKEGLKLGNLTDEQRKALGLSKFKEKIAQMQEKSISSTDEYQNIMKNSLKGILDERASLEPAGWNKAKQAYLSLGDIVREKVEELPYGESLLKAFDMNPGVWFRQAILKDKLKNLREKKIPKLEIVRDPVTGEVISTNEEEVKKAFDEVTGIYGDYKPVRSMSDMMPDTPLGQRVQEAPARKLSEMVDESILAAKSPSSITRSEDALTNSQRMLGEANETYVQRDLVKILTDEARMAAKDFDTEKTGLKWYDEKVKMLNEIKTKNGTPWVKNTLDAYSGFINFFKGAKVNALSPSAIVNAAVGNPTMAFLAGVDITRRSYFSAIKDSWDFLTGNGANFMKKYFPPDNPSSSYILNFIKEHENTFGKVIGLNERSFSDDAILQMAKKNAEEVGVTLNAVDLIKKLKQLKGEMKSTPLQKYRKDLKEGKISSEELPTSFSAEMYGNSEYYLKIKNWAESNQNTNLAAKAIDAIINKGVSGYERIDQSHKLGLFVHAITNGFSEGELLKISRAIPMKYTDIEEKYKSGGRYLYRLKPEKALEFSSIIYMNYAAMPAAVKILRSLPILGSPFASFSYGMGAKTIESALYNPAVFNKINFLMSEISGPKTPLEKEAMLQGYYTNFSQTGMVKLPFSRENPLYLNVTNMIPYLSFNMFTENGRKYSDQFPDRMTSMVDSSPLLKDPVGQVIFDNIIQPMLLQGEQPQSSFGTPIYPATATPLEKSGYALRQLGEALTPSGPLAVAGAIAGLTPLSEAAIETVPSYRFRGLARAVRGEDVQGMKRKEHPASRTMRTGFSTAGLPTSQMDLDFMANTLSKKK